MYRRSSAVAAILGGSRQAAQQRFARAGAPVSAPPPPLAPDLAPELLITAKTQPWHPRNCKAR